MGKNCKELIQLIIKILLHFTVEHGEGLKVDYLR